MAAHTENSDPIYRRDVPAGWPDDGCADIRSFTASRHRVARITLTLGLAAVFFAVAPEAGFGLRRAGARLADRIGGGADQLRSWRYERSRHLRCHRDEFRGARGKRQQRCNHGHAAGRT